MTISRHAFTELLSRNIFPLRRKVRWIKKRRKKKKKKNVQIAYSKFCEIKNPFSDSNGKINASIQSPLSTIQELRRTNKKKKRNNNFQQNYSSLPFFFRANKNPFVTRERKREKGDPIFRFTWNISPHNFHGVIRDDTRISTSRRETSYNQFLEESQPRREEEADLFLRKGGLLQALSL